MSTQPKTFLTPEQYLEIERKAKFKSEYFQGEMFAMAGGSPVHGQLISNLIMRLGPNAVSRSCLICPSDLRVRISPTGLYTYPDVVIVCGKPQLVDGRKDTITNPTFIAEVLSSSTEAYDRGVKFDHYRTLESLREYLLVSSDRISAHLLSRQADNSWVIRSADGPDASIHIQTVDVELVMRDLYVNTD